MFGMASLFKSTFSDFENIFLCFPLKLHILFPPIFLFLSLNQVLAAGFFVLGPYVWEIFGTEGVCHPPDICIVEVGLAIEKG